MIKKSKIKDNKYKKLDTMPDAYYYCVWVIGDDKPLFITKEDEFVTPPNYPNFHLDNECLASSVSNGYANFIKELKKEGVVNGL